MKPSIFILVLILVISLSIGIWYFIIFKVIKPIMFNTIVEVIETTLEKP